MGKLDLFASSMINTKFGNIHNSNIDASMTLPFLLKWQLELDSISYSHKLWDLATLRKKMFTVKVFDQETSTKVIQKCMHWNKWRPLAMGLYDNSRMICMHNYLDGNPILG